MSSLPVTKSSFIFFLHLLSIMSDTSAAKKATIVTRKEMGMPNWEIAEKQNVAPSTISWITTHYGKTHQFNAKKPKPGYPNNCWSRTPILPAEWFWQRRKRMQLTSKGSSFHLFTSIHCKGHSSHVIWRHTYVRRSLSWLLHIRGSKGSVSWTHIFYLIFCILYGFIWWRSSV